MNSESTGPAETSGLAEQLNFHIQYEEASNGQRFLNWLIDNCVLRFGLTYLTGTAFGYLLGTLFPEWTMRVILEESWEIYLLGYIIGIFNYLLYYPICEKGFRGYTLGKLITGTRAICDDGSELTFRDAFMRTLVRLIPFEVFSGLGPRPWHDTWTKTSVIKSR